ncbi:MAG: XrtA-associated ATPase [Dissulfurispiraceae bacterium]|jgi:putative secretion ATPase (PEP-CTERM system associated)|nr:XrtA-associated ATPase [Dissulfurispiraceae bacterium]
MYIGYFNLKCKPFELVPDPEFLLMSRGHKRALTHLNYGIVENSGFILVTGEVGTGKTTIIRSMMKKLNSDIKLARINNTRVSSEQLISMINEDFGLEIKGKTKIEMLSDLTDFLIVQYASGGRSMLIIDEAQNLSIDLLEEIRLLSNLETDKSKLLQIILVGQPELLKTLGRPELRQLRQRISISCQIIPITKDETAEYIFHRLEVAGNRNAVEFCGSCIDIIHAFSRGIPRLINIACDFLLLSAFAEESRVITEELVREVLGEIEMTHGYWQDEAPESLVVVPDAGSEEKNMDLLARLENIEAIAHRVDISKAEREDILLRLAQLEDMIEKTINHFNNELSALGTKKIEIQLLKLNKDIGAVKNKLLDFETRTSYTEPEVIEKKKTIWGRIFN